MVQPLDGIRILDWTLWQQGPVSTAMLADLGAEVIKIEERESGDPGRGVTRIGGVDVEEQINYYFEANNRHKKSITLNLKRPEAREIVYALVAKSDVFVQNYRKGVAGRLSLDYSTLKQYNAKLIYANATGYGPLGPDSAEPSFDLMGQARSGIMNAVGEPGMDPLSVSGGIADQMGAVMLAYGILAALMARERHGIGQEVNASHLGSMIQLQGLSVSMRLMRGKALRPGARTAARNPIWNHYKCGDGKWIAFAMIQADRYWIDFCRTIERPDMVEDERFKGPRARAKNAEAAVAIIDDVFAKKPSREWLDILKGGGDLIYTIVNTIDDLPEDPQVLANDYIMDFDHPRFGPTQVVGNPVGFSETPGDPRGAAPELGEHTEQVLIDVLGYDWDKIGELRDAEII